jgi:hypothetical protein
MPDPKFNDTLFSLYGAYQLSIYICFTNREKQPQKLREDYQWFSFVCFNLGINTISK